MLCLGKDFWGGGGGVGGWGGGGGTGVPLPEFQGTFANSGGHTKSVKIFTCLLNTVSRLNPVTISGSF